VFFVVEADLSDGLFEPFDSFDSFDSFGSF